MDSTTNLRQEAKEVITSHATLGMEAYYELLHTARAKRDEAMVRHWTRRIEERKRLLERMR